MPARDLAFIDATLPQLDALAKPTRSDVERSKARWKKQAPAELANLIDATLHEPAEPQS